MLLWGIALHAFLLLGDSLDDSYQHMGSLGSISAFTTEVLAIEMFYIPLCVCVCVCVCFSQVPSSNGTSAESGPYWSQVAQPRKFTEGTSDEPETTETKPKSNQSDIQNVLKDEQQRAGDEGGEVGNDPSNSGVNSKDGLEDTKLIPPPPPPGAVLRTSAPPTMPPPSFLPARATLPPSASKCNTAVQRWVRINDFYAN